jgi:hypothetical protein
MSLPSRAELREWTAALTLGPLDVSDPAETRYVELADAGRGAVDDLQATIELSLEATTQLLTGPSGSGKTTELYRLRRDLQLAGYDATVFDITSYLNESSPVDVTEFLIALALGAHDAVGPDRSGGRRPGFVARLRGLLQRLNIDIEIAGVTATLSGDSVEIGALGSSVGINLSEELKSSRPFVDELRAKLSYHVKQLYDEVAAFLQELLPPEPSDDADAPDQGYVFIVDGLEKLRGAGANDPDVQKSIEALFVNHASKLKFASHHLVYTVPTYLQFTSPGALPYNARLFVPVPHLHVPGGSVDAAAAQNRVELRDVVARRIPVERVFESEAALDAVLDASGGHLRDLFLILQRLINLMLRLSLELPVGPADVEEAVRLVARDFAAMTEEQAAFLKTVAAGHGLVRPHADEVQLMARLVQSHMLLGHSGDEDWYEVHPLARRALGMP